jgi:ribosomal protein L37AE/L43A
MSEQAAEFSHEEKNCGQDEKESRLGHGIWKNTSRCYMVLSGSALA